MSGSVNKVTLLGRLGQDPESRETKDGRKVVSFSVATDERWRDQASDDTRERTEWHRVAIFNERLADVASAYLRKGNQVYLEGQLQTRHWDDAHGQPRITKEIVLSGYQAYRAVRWPQCRARRGGGLMLVAESSAVNWLEWVNRPPLELSDSMAEDLITYAEGRPLDNETETDLDRWLFEFTDRESEEEYIEAADDLEGQMR